MTQDTEDVVALIAQLRTGKRSGPNLLPEGSQWPLIYKEWSELGGKAADALQSLSDRIDGLEARQHGGENGASGDAIDFACDHCGPEEAQAFLEDWRSDRANEWPGYVKWLAVQRAGAAEARAALHQEGI